MRGRASGELLLLALKPSGPALVQVVHIVFGDRQQGNLYKPVWRVLAVLNRVEKEINRTGSPIVNLLGKQLIGVALPDILESGWVRDNSSPVYCARGPFSRAVAEQSPTCEHGPAVNFGMRLHNLFDGRHRILRCLFVVK